MNLNSKFSFNSRCLLLGESRNNERVHMLIVSRCDQATYRLIERCHSFRFEILLCVNLIDVAGKLELLHIGASETHSLNSIHVKKSPSLVSLIC